jgi:ABC-type bacteriocin/lantibiotic exporter with double-glycine peptidase domain
MSIKTLNIIRIVLLVVAIVLIVIGLIQGQYFSVLSKAIRTCLECIGIA